MRVRSREEREADRVMDRLVSYALFSSVSRSGADYRPGNVGSLVTRMSPTERAKLGPLTSDSVSVCSIHDEVLAYVAPEQFRLRRPARNVAGQE